jgi:peroxiredoxin
MAALASGTIAPGFTLPTVDGQKFSLTEALKRGPVVAVFFKITCPVCQFALPYLERLYQAHRGKGVSIVGISQSDAKDTRQFMSEYGISFPVLLDDPQSYPVSNAYGLTNVPTVFLITPGGEIDESIVGWSRPEMEQLSQSIGRMLGTEKAQIFQPGENVPEFQAG